VDAERALSAATDKFITRFSAVEAAAEAEGKTLAEMSIEEREKLWQNAKKINKNC
jgi:tetrapyrrole methylase family protein/MazG family protein